MKNCVIKVLLTAIALWGLAIANATAAPVETVEFLPYSNAGADVSTGTSPGAIVVDPTTPTRIEEGTNTSCHAILGGTYRRALVSIQNVGTEIIWWGYTDDVTASNGHALYAGQYIHLAIGRYTQVYGLSASGNGDARVSALCYRK